MLSLQQISEQINSDTALTSMVIDVTANNQVIVAICIQLLQQVHTLHKKWWNFPCLYQNHQSASDCIQFMFHVFVMPSDCPFLMPKRQDMATCCVCLMQYHMVCIRVTEPSIRCGCDREYPIKFQWSVTDDTRIAFSKKKRLTLSFF